LEHRGAHVGVSEQRPSGPDDVSVHQQVHRQSVVEGAVVLVVRSVLDGRMGVYRSMGDAPRLTNS
jgi:hypothetical protein